MTWVEPSQWYAQLASFYAAAAVFVTDSAGRVLLVKPNYRNDWALPGGYVDQDENPNDAAARELQEELALVVPIGQLLVVDWASPAGPRPRPLVNFLFDGGQVPQSATILVNSDELETSTFCYPNQAQQLLPPRVAPRVEAALEARAKGTTAYLLDGVAAGHTAR